MPGTVLGDGDTAVNRTGKRPSMAFTSRDKYDQIT